MPGSAVHPRVCCLRYVGRLSCSMCLPQVIHRHTQRQKADARPCLLRLADEGVDDKPEGDDNKEERRPGISGSAVGTHGVRLSGAENEHTGSGQSEEYPVSEHHVGDQILERSPEQDQHDRPERLDDDRKCGCLITGMKPRHPSEEQPILRHGVVDAWERSACRCPLCRTWR